MQFAVSKMSRAASLGLEFTCGLSFRQVPFLPAGRQFAGAGAGAAAGWVDFRVCAKPCCFIWAREKDVENGRVGIGRVSFDLGPSLRRGRLLRSRQLETVPKNLAEAEEEEKSQSGLNFQVDNSRLSAAAAASASASAIVETNLVNAKALAAELVQADGSVKRFVKGAELDRDGFSRAFDLVALRVPAEECGVWVSRLQGHLLNWPRVKNVQRVEGDEGDAALKSLLGETNPTLETPESRIQSVRAAVYPGKRSAGDGEGAGQSKRKFPNLRKLTGGVDSDLVQSIRPRESGRGLRSRSSSNANAWEEGAATVELVGECQNSDHHDSEPREATRLLLLDETFRDKPKGELPQAVQTALGNYGCELVRCQLTLTYDYWVMDEILKEVLPLGMTIPTAFESVGHIAHLNLRKEHTPYRRTIAQIVLEKNKPRIRTVVNKTDVIHNRYRTMQLELLAGNSSLITTVVEHGFSFRLDLASVYWNSRLATERQRLVDLFNEDDIVCDLFAGVGPIAVVAAKKVKFVFANDLNPIATAYMQQNLIINKLAYKVEVSNEDARLFVRKLLARDVLFSQVVMNLPLDAAEFLDVFVHAFSRDVWKRETLPRIHVYGFSKAKNPEADYSERIADILNEMPQPMHIHRVRLVAPGKLMLCASFRLPASVAFSELSTIRQYA